MDLRPSSSRAGRAQLRSGEDLSVRASGRAAPECGTEQEAAVTAGTRPRLSLPHKHAALLSHAHKPAAVDSESTVC